MIAAPVAWHADEREERALGGARLARALLACKVGMFSGSSLMRAVLLSCAIANAAAFIAPSRAPQWLAPQLAAVLPPRALPTASLTRRGPTALSTFSTEEIVKELARRRRVDKRSDVLQVCPARTRGMRAFRAWPRCLHKGYGGRKGSHECIPSKCLCRPPTPPYVQSLLSVQEPSCHPHLMTLLFTPSPRTLNSPHCSRLSVPASAPAGKANCELVGRT